MPLLDHFDLLAPFYDSLIQFQAAERLISMAGLPVAGLLLDAGGGTGRVSQTLTGQAGQIVVADISHKMLRQAAGKKGLKPVRAHTEALPFPSHAFDRIIMVDAFHHLIDQVQTAREMWRLLKPGGRILIEEPDIRTLAVKLVAIVEKVALMRSRFLSPARIASLFYFPHVRTQIKREGFNAWIVIDKLYSDGG
jgi:demethylmenaquinone methyltransferase/2-methoxy-6-polyprenyl-1,4-benzoquinol methylase